jgi:hypothetical protein
MYSSISDSICQMQIGGRCSFLHYTSHLGLGIEIYRYGKESYQYRYDVPVYVRCDKYGIYEDLKWGFRQVTEKRVMRTNTGMKKSYQYIVPSIFLPLVGTVRTLSRNLSLLRSNLLGYRQFVGGSALIHYISSCSFIVHTENVHIHQDSSQSCVQCWIKRVV